MEFLEMQAENHIYLFYVWKKGTKTKQMDKR